MYPIYVASVRDKKRWNIDMENSVLFIIRQDSGIGHLLLGANALERLSEELVELSMTARSPFLMVFLVMETMTSPPPSKYDYPR